MSGNSSIYDISYCDTDTNICILTRIKLFFLDMAQLTDLSNEILLLVWAFLPAVDKATISHVCKWLQHFAEPLLYANIRMVWKLFSSRISIELLLLKILNAPALSYHVKQLAIVGIRKSRFNNSQRRDCLSDPNLEVISNLTRSVAPIGHEGVWEEMAARQDTDLYEAMVISQLSNLTQLTIGYGPFLNIKLVSDMFRRVLCSEKALEGLSGFFHLKQDDLRIDMTHKEFQLNGLKNFVCLLLPFFYLPSIQELLMVMPYNGGDFTLPVTQPCTKS